MIAKRCVSRVNGNYATAVLSPGGVFASGNKRDNKADIDHFRVAVREIYNLLIAR